jgi:hypothetical protein
MRWARHMARMAKRNSYRVLTINPGGKGPLRRPRRGWENCKEILWGGIA